MDICFRKNDDGLIFLLDLWIIKIIYTYEIGFFPITEINSAIKQLTNA